MAKLTRYLQKIFANNSNQVGVFGTGVDKETSKNVETLQSADYENGWSSAIITNKNYPIWQERDGVDYGLSYQIKYLDQAGIAEWLSTETYYTDCYCRYGSDIYISLKDDNTNHSPLLNDGWWMIIDKKFLNKQQITNCLLEVPHHINYTLTDGAFTLKAGSVVIVPYGTTDLSSTYTVGSTFINEILKVYDREFVDGRFIVWAQLQNDVVRAASAGGTTAIKTAALVFTDSTIAVTNAGNAESVASDASASSSSLFYNTTDNLVKTKSSGTVSSNIGSFPILKSLTDETYNFSKVKQVFYGIGYIGSALWVDKGVKTLTPNGLNTDGTLNNIKHIQPNFSIYNYNSISDGNKILRYLPTSERLGYEETTSTYYDVNTNYNRLTSDNSIAVSSCFIGKFNVISNAITSFTVNPTLNINSLIDGKTYPVIGGTIAEGASLPSSTNIEYDLSSFLPNTNDEYMALITGTIATGTAVNNLSALRISTSILIGGDIRIAQTRAYSSSANYNAGSAWVPIGADKKISVDANSNNTGTFNLYIRAYRRIGGNF